MYKNMPYNQVGMFRGGNARARYNAAALNQAIKLAKQAMRMKSDYDKKKATTKPAAKGRGRPKGSKNKPKGKPYARAMGIRNVTSGVHTYSKIAPKSYKGSQMARKFPQLLYQTYYITSPESYTDLNPGVDGTITNPDMLYSEPSVEWTNASIHLFNVHNTERHWMPTVGFQQDGYRTGTQLTNIPADPDRQLGTVSTFENDSFIFVNDPTNIKLVSVRCPFKQNGLAENAVGAYAGGDNTWTCPNSSLQSLEIDLLVGNPTIQDEYITLKVVRLNDGDTTLVPGTLGADNAQRTALTQTICNSGKFTNPQQFSTIWSYRWRQPGLATGKKMRYNKVKKTLSLNYLRSNYRKQYNANNLNTIGLDAMPSYVLSDDDSFFNGVFIVLQSNCIDNEYIADVNIEKGGSGQYANMFQERMPQIAKYPPVGIPDSVENAKYKPISAGAQHCVSGTIQVVHRVQAKRRAIGSTTSEALSLMQQKIDSLEAHSKYFIHKELHKDGPNLAITT